MNLAYTKRCDAKRYKDKRFMIKSKINANKSTYLDCAIASLVHYELYIFKYT